MVLSHRGTGIFRICRLVHLEAAGSRAVDVVCDGGLAGGKFPGPARHSEDDWLASG